MIKPLWAVAGAALLGTAGIISLLAATARAQAPTLTVTPASGPTGTSVALQGGGCNNPGQPTRLSFGVQNPEVGTGTVGAVDLPDIPTNSDGTFRTIFVIPDRLDSFQGQGGGPVVAGSYQFFSNPPVCATTFTVTAGTLPVTGGKPDNRMMPLFELVLLATSVTAVTFSLAMMLKTHRGNRRT